MRDDILLRVNDHIVLRDTAYMVLCQQLADAHRSADRANSGIDQGIRIYQSGAARWPVRHRRGTLRVLAAQLLKMMQVPCIELGYLTEAQRKAYVIADDRLVLNAGWDEHLLAIELNGFGKTGISISG